MSHCGALPRGPIGRPRAFMRACRGPARHSSPATQCSTLDRTWHPGAPRQAEAQRSGEPEQLRSAEHDQNNPFLRSASSARLASHLHFGDAESFETGKVAIVKLPLALSHTLWSHLQAQSRSGS